MRKGLTQDQTDMKLANLITIFNILYDKTPISRADLAKVSGMSPTSITRFVNNMQKVNLLREMPSDEKKVGRTATLLDINESAFYSVGINIDSTYIHVSILNFRKKVIADQYLKMDTSSPSIEQVLDIAYQLYQGTLTDSGIDPTHICGIGVSVVGTMNDSDMLLITSQLKWRDVNLRLAVAEKFHMENVLVENDCDSALIGQCVLHPEYKEKAVACICIGTGVGSAISYQGALLSPPGRNPFSEIGHCCRKQKRFAAVILYKQFDRFKTGLIEKSREHMGLVKDDNALSDIVQFSHLRWLVAVERFKKLNIRGDYDRGIPIFRSKSEFLSRIGVFQAVIIKITVMFQYRVFTENAAKYLRILLYDARIRNDVNYPFQIALFYKFKCKIHAGKCLAAACRHIHCKNLCIVFTVRQSLLQQSISRFLNSRFARERRNLLI